MEQEGEGTSLNLAVKSLMAVSPANFSASSLILFVAWFWSWSMLPLSKLLSPQVLVLLIHLLPQLLTSFSSCAAASAARGHYLFFPNIAKGTTDPRVEFILSKLLLEVISQVQTQILNQNQNQNLD